MPQEPSALDLQVISAADKVAYLVDRAWALPILLALRHGGMDRDALTAAAQLHRPDRHLTARMFSHTAQNLEAHELVTITRSPEHPDNQTGARYALTTRARAIMPLIQHSLLLFSQPAQDGDGSGVGGDSGHDLGPAAS